MAYAPYSDFKKLPDQAKLIVAAGVAALLLRVGRNRTAKTETLILVAIVTLLMTLLSVYNSKCLLNGKCEMWAWVVAGSFAFVQILGAYYERIQ